MAFGAGAQELTVVSPMTQDGPNITAKKMNRRTPNTDEVCALVLVRLASKKVTFINDYIVGEVGVNDAGEYMVFMAPGARRLKILVKGCIPFEYTFPEKLKTQSVYKMTLGLPDMTKAIIMPQYSIPTYSQGSLHGSYGLMVGFVKKHGAFLRAKSDFNFIKTSGECDASGLMGGRLPWYTGETERSRWAVTAGYVARVVKPLYVYGGVGYGQRVIAREQMDGTLVECSDVTHKGIEAEIGVIGRIGVFALSAGVQTNSFKYMEINVGVGVMF